MKKIISFILVIFFCSQSFAFGKTSERVRVIARPDNPLVLPGQKSYVVIKVGLFPDDKGIDFKRLPMNIAIVLDKSGSMGSQSKMENAKRGAIEIINRLSSKDILSVIVYDNAPYTLISAQHVINKEAIISQIRSISSGGSTALYGGVSFGASEIYKNLTDNYINRIILLSDGLANVGPQSTEDLACLGENLESQGISVTTIGVGLDYNEDLMTVLADRSSGNSYFARNSDELPQIFAEEIGEAMTLMACNVRVLLECPDNIRPVSIIGRKGVVNDRDMEVIIGNLYGSSEKYTLFEVEIPEGKDGRNLKAARIRIEYDDPFTQKKVFKKMDVSIQYEKNKKTVEAKKDKEVLKDTAINRTAEVKARAIALADKGQYKEAAHLIEQNSEELEKVARQCDNDKDLINKAKECQEVSGQLNFNKSLSREQRKRLKNDHYTTINQQGYIAK
ncbi:MAG: VWA domain-containing protein [Candidatus Aureabacteria bacterium]|nr:VWA domain-containing protein [Candidatus Auribacterota bacterium]